jgi:hypothetical protein
MDREEQHGSTRALGLRGVAGERATCVQGCSRCGYGGDHTKTANCSCACHKLRAENDRLRDLYENAVTNRKNFGWTINHLLECEEALRMAEGEATAIRELAQRAVPFVQAVLNMADDRTPSLAWMADAAALIGSESGVGANG